MLPAGPAGALLLAPAVLAMGVITVGYPVAYSATRTDAIFGTVAAFLVAANAAALLVTTQVDMGGIQRSMALGVLAGVLALGPVLVGLWSIAALHATWVRPAGRGDRHGGFGRAGHRRPGAGVPPGLTPPARRAVRRRTRESGCEPWRHAAGSQQI